LGSDESILPIHSQQVFVKCENIVFLYMTLSIPHGVSDEDPVIKVIKISATFEAIIA
jgi:hypothetical protein